MIHEAMMLEYSARHLALIEWAAALKLFAYCTASASRCSSRGASPRAATGRASARWRSPLLVVKLARGGTGLARASRRVSAKMRIFRAPEFLGTAFLLGRAGMLVHLLLRELTWRVLPLYAQLINLLAAILLLHRVRHALAAARAVAHPPVRGWQGLVLAISTRDRRLGARTRAICTRRRRSRWC